MVTKSTKTRAELDSLGVMRVPTSAYYGAHTQRALHNFQVTGRTIGETPRLPWALAAVKEAAAVANTSLGLLDQSKGRAIVEACGEIRAGHLQEHFVVDPIQGGAGTSSNMNANEVIANRALELLGHSKGEYEHLDPLDDVNMGQSTNDVYPTAGRLCVRAALVGLVEDLGLLQDAFARKAKELGDVLKVGRTQLQDAVPMTFEQEFNAYAVTLDKERARLRGTTELMLECNLGGTAIGTGINSHPDFGRFACAHLSLIVGEQLRLAPDLIEATQDCGDFVEVSGALKRLAVKVSKICNDLRLMSSGPSAGFHDINLPPVQAGSSIMPGKLNPVVPEFVNQVAFMVVGNDMSVTMAAEGGQLQLNAFEPLIVYKLTESARSLGAAMKTLASRCVDGITANNQRAQRLALESVGTVTALAPSLGYAESARIAKLALASGDHVRNLVIEQGILPAEEVDRLLDVKRMARPHIGT